MAANLIYEPALGEMWSLYVISSFCIIIILNSGFNLIVASFYLQTCLPSPTPPPHQEKKKNLRPLRHVHGLTNYMYREEILCLSGNHGN